MPPRSQSDLWLKQLEDECRDREIARAVTQLHSLKLASYYQAHYRRA